MGIVQFGSVNLKWVMTVAVKEAWVEPCQSDLSGPTPEQWCCILFSCQFGKPTDNMCGVPSGETISSTTRVQLGSASPCK